ncbi:MAG: exo-alpha-sialidase [Rhizobiales bacterium]|nr:exo-alpha-sialidase [Hyphomicrobiales bacterium]
MKTQTLPIAICAIVTTAAIALSFSTAVADTIKVADLGSHTHIHGLAVDRVDPNHLFIATHHGLYRAGPDGSAELVSVVQDFMGFNAHPSVPGYLLASGHPAGGGNLGFIVSKDGGKTWTEVSPGIDGPVDFHQMSVSPADPETIYGAYGELQVSHDGGKSWAIAGQLPERLIDLAASTLRGQMLYAATETGLSVSHDGGVSWQTLIDEAPVTMVDTAPDGTLYAFVIGRGLVSAKEGVFDFLTVNGEWGDGFLLHFAVDPTDPDRLYAASSESEVLESADGGATWSAFGGGS